MSRSLLLVTGAGRSGTSTIAGTLYHLGVHVPGPYLKANETNPRGFYESKWSVDFHNRLLKRANVSIADGRPEAAGLMREAFRAEDADALAGWLEESAAPDGWTAVKDPRTTWTLDRWAAATGRLGMDIGYVVMLRHPAEVLGSRATHYGSRAGALEPDAFAVRNLAGWVNAMLMTERGTRGGRRSFLRYDDLLSDWRSAMGRVSDQVGLDLEPVPAGTAHEVDDFIDPGLSRHRLTWDDVPVPPELAALAEEVWSACERLADGTGEDADAQAAMDAARERYDAMYRAAQQLAADTIAAATNEGVRKGRREARRQDRKEGRQEDRRAAQAADAGVVGRLKARARQLRRG